MPGPAPEPYTPPAPALTGALLDRASAPRHDPQWVSRLLEEPTATSVAAGADGVLVQSSGPPALLRRPIAADGLPTPDPAAVILLGIEDGAALFAIDLDELEPARRSRAAVGGEIVSLRDAGAVLGHAEAGLAAYLTALLNWHRRHRFCANCGAATRIVEAGNSRHCPNCGASHFPRTDPVVIMLVEHDGSLLLGDVPAGRRDRYSVLAGFVSPGETLEEAVVREVREESGVEVHDPTYVASQPWPFPSSLMLGFAARSEGGQPKARDGELEDVRWVTLEEVRAAREGTGRFATPAADIDRSVPDRGLGRGRYDGRLTAVSWPRARLAADPRRAIVAA